MHHVGGKESCIGYGTALLPLHPIQLQIILTIQLQIILIISSMAASTAAEGLEKFLATINEGGSDSFWWHNHDPEVDKVCKLSNKLDPAILKQRTDELTKLNIKSL